MKPRLDVDLALVDTPQAWAYVVITVHQPWPRRRRLLGLAALGAITAVVLFPVLMRLTTRPPSAASVQAEALSLITRAAATLHEALCAVAPLEERACRLSSDGRG
jgi:hypothetical protein